MDEITERSLNEKCSAGMAMRHFHKLGPQQWRYNDDLADLSGVPHLPIAVPSLYEAVFLDRKRNLTLYKTHNYRITGPDSFEVISN